MIRVKLLPIISSIIFLSFLSSCVIKPMEAQNADNQSTIGQTKNEQPTNNSPGKQFDYVSQLGAVEPISENELCLIIPNRNLAEGDKIEVIFADDPQAQSSITAVVAKKAERCARKNHEVPEKGFEYLLKVVSGSYQMMPYQELNPVGIAVVGVRQKINFVGGAASLDLEEDGQPDFFRTCTSNEGIHLTVWSGKPLESERKWHWYVDLNFDTVPTCVEKDYRE